MDLKKLVQKWEEVLNEGHEIGNERVKKSTALMLENQHRFLTGQLTEAGTSYTGGHMDPQSAGYYDSTAGVGDAMFHKIAVPMVRRTFPELIAHEIVGVQPLTGPVGLAFALRFVAGSTYGGSSPVTGAEIGYNTIDNAFSGTGTSPSGTGAARATAETWGSVAGTGVGNDIGLGIGAGTHIKEVGMTIEKDQVEATTRKLRSRWSLEVAQDIKAMHGLDLEEEMMDVLSYEITAEIDRELVQRIDSSATNTNWNYDTQADGRWESERFRTMYNLMIRRANQIAINTRRGAGNFAIANPLICAAFETLSNFSVHPVPNDVNTAVTGVARIGSLDGRITLYRDTFESDDQFIVGYKGPSEYDTGIIYLPYIQLLVSRATFEDSFNPTIGLMSRYAIHDHMFGASLYYEKVTVQDFLTISELS